MALEIWNRAVVTGISDMTENTKRFFFEVPELEVFHFIPGQFWLLCMLPTALVPITFGRNCALAPLYNSKVLPGYLHFPKK